MNHKSYHIQFMLQKYVSDIYLEGTPIPNSMGPRWRLPQAWPRPFPRPRLRRPGGWTRGLDAGRGSPNCLGGDWRTPKMGCRI